MHSPEGLEAEMLIYSWLSCGIASRLKTPDLVVVPLSADQFFNAHVTHSIRLGQVVQREQPTPASIRAAVEQVPANPTYRQTAGRLQAERHALPDQQYAVGLVEEVAMAGFETAV